jgi:hypothetical protein
MGRGTDETRQIDMLEILISILKYEGHCSFAIQTCTLIDWSTY